MTRLMSLLGNFRLRRRHLRRQSFLIVLVSTWLFVLYSIRGNYRTEQLFQTTGDNDKVHETVQRWHEDDSATKPKLFLDWNRKSYREDSLFEWTEPEVERGDPESPGHFGEPLNLNGAKADEAKAKSSKHQLNVVASDLIPLNRVLSDYRNQRCIEKSYPSLLPQATVIVIFHNEAKSTLLRTIESVINRSPPQLLRKIVLVDDNSDNEELFGPLQEHLEKLPIPSRIVRTGERVGLIRARLFGAEEAAKDKMDGVLIFLDAHVEVTKGWLPPLLAEIASDRSRVIVPVIDSVSHETFEYEPIEDDHERGGLDWKLLHFWIGAGGRRISEDESDAFPTPTMIGCAFAIDREFFYASGSYDEQMKIWGGENVEMSVRIWRCGGSLLKAPCSRIGHVYRVTTPHSIPGGVWAKVETAAANTARFAQVWLDPNYLNFYYMMNPSAKSLDIGDLTSRLKLRDDLKCHSFQWFLDHVYPDSGFPNKVDYVGQVQSVDTSLCLDALSTRGPPGMRVCHGLGGFQTIMLTRNKELRSASRCLEPFNWPREDSNVNVTFATCDSTRNQTWTVDLERDKVVHDATGRCLTFSGEASRPAGGNKMVLQYLASIVKDIARTVEYPTLEICRDDLAGQKWKFNAPLKWDEKP